MLRKGARGEGVVKNVKERGQRWGRG